MFSCNLPPALLAEWPGSFTCYCGNTGVERIPTLELFHSFSHWTSFTDVSLIKPEDSINPSFKAILYSVVMGQQCWGWKLHPSADELGQYLFNFFFFFFRHEITWIAVHVRLDFSPCSHRLRYGGCGGWGVGVGVGVGDFAAKNTASCLTLCRDKYLLLQKEPASLMLQMTPQIGFPAANPVSICNDSVYKGERLFRCYSVKDTFAPATLPPLFEAAKVKLSPQRALVCRCKSIIVAAKQKSSL